MGWTAERIVSHGVVVKDDGQFAARMGALSAEAAAYRRTVARDRFGGTRRARVRKRRFEPLREAGEVFVFACVSTNVCDEGRLGTMPLHYCRPRYAHSFGERSVVMDADERHLHELVVRHFPEGRLATFETTMCAAQYYAAR